ncbi:MAG: ATP-dependent sacrificial sulfur transferase LarE [Planctomycetes bacterium]|nr:ATP-dependent sacrificial sulfur transferase LarE [Planctomycetota bacterium]
MIPDGGTATLTRSLDEKRRVALEVLRAAVPAGAGRLGVAFSGGVDSSLLLALACEALGSERVIAVTARSESLAGVELEACRRIARGVGARLVLLVTRELEREGYRRNGPDRCYHCKTELFERIEDEVLADEGLVAVAYGATADDVGDHRPGMDAARERRILAPLLEAGLTKVEIRRLSGELGLETHDKPAQPCLASRIPYGQAVTGDKLRRIEAAEALVRGLGFVDLRVRHHGDEAEATARIEVPLEQVAALAAPGTREAVVRGLRGLGFRYVVLDLEGFRSGRLNEALRRLPVAAAESEAGVDGGEGR